MPNVTNPAPRIRFLMTTTHTNRDSVNELEMVKHAAGRSSALLLLRLRMYAHTEGRIQGTELRSAADPQPRVRLPERAWQVPGSRCIAQFATRPRPMPHGSWRVSGTSLCVQTLTYSTMYPEVTRVLPGFCIPLYCFQLSVLSCGRTTFAVTTPTAHPLVF
nr:hypothetical protein CFP56_53593 [Quercus suber]